MIRIIALCLLLGWINGAAAAEVFVAGATGRTGRLIVEGLVAKGFTVRGLTRDVARAKAEIALPVAWFEGDVREPKTLLAPMRGLTLAVSAIGATEMSGPNSHEFVDWGGNVNLIDTAIGAGVRHFVLVSTGSAAPVDPGVEQRRTRGWPWKSMTEDYLRASGLPYTIIAPGGLEDYAAGEQPVLLRPRSGYASARVSRGDIAAVVVACLANDVCRRKTITVVNDARGTKDWAAALATMPLDTPDSIRFGSSP